MNEMSIVNPMQADRASNVVRPSNSAVATAHTDQQRAIAEVQAAMMVARASPRDQIEAMDRILNACQRPTLATVAVYQYARGGSNISGPSIRLAEALAQNWGNIQFGIRELEQRRGESIVQAYAWDVETNVRREMVFSVPHVRHTKGGSKHLEDPRDIYEVVANNGARRLRSCILSVIPGDVIDAAVSQCEVTMNVTADTTPKGIATLMQAFADFGVTREQIEARIQRRIEAIQPAQVVALRKVYASLRDGMSTPSDWFDQIAEPDQPQSGIDAAKAALKGRRKAKADTEHGASPPRDGDEHDESRWAATGHSELATDIIAGLDDCFGEEAAVEWLDHCGLMTPDGSIDLSGLPGGDRPIVENAINSAKARGLGSGERGQ